MLSKKYQQLCDSVAKAAEQELLGSFKQIEADIKSDGSMVTAADLAMQQRIQELLSNNYPDCGFLSEEMSAEEQEKALATPDSDVWVLDPLDGTSNFAMGIPYFAVSLALIRDQSVSFALVHDPVRRETFYAQRNRGAWLNRERLGSRIPQHSLARGIGLVDFKRLPVNLARRLATTPPYSSQRNFGAVALEYCWVAAGRGHVYLHGRCCLSDYLTGSFPE
ncbi:MAG: inositol monophosphatase family protein [Pseudomonadota bacterium]